MIDINLMQGDCLERMKEIPDGSVDMVLCDLPYGVTQCEWDEIIPFEPLWAQYHRVCKKSAAIVLFSQLPFMIDLICSNRKEFRYEWIYEKSISVGFLNANNSPLKKHENILVFYQKLPTYNPQFSFGKKPYSKFCGDTNIVYNKRKRLTTVSSDGRRYPTDIVSFPCDASRFDSSKGKQKEHHPTKKPVALCEYLVRTYTNENEVVLDNCMGSGTTGVACVNAKRKFIGIEKEQKYFEVAQKRIKDAQAQLTLF